MILLSTDNKPWTEDGFRSSWRKACKKAGIVGVTFNDLRGTAVTRLAIAGCTEAEIVAITGHTLRDVRSILDAHYLTPRPGAGRGRNQEARSENKFSQTGSQLGFAVLSRNRGKCNAINWLGDLDSNQDWRSQSPLSYR